MLFNLILNCLNTSSYLYYREYDSKIIYFYISLFNVYLAAAVNKEDSLISYY